MSFLTVGLLAASLSLAAGVVSHNSPNEKVAPKLEVNRALPSMPASPSVTLEAWELYKGEASYLFDDDDSTVYWLYEPGEYSYLDIEFSSPVEIYDIQIKFNGNDYLRHSTWKWSNDGAHFMVIDDFNLYNEDSTANVKAYGVSATHIRLQTGGGNSGNWVQIKEIKINQGTYSHDLIQKVSFANFALNYLPTDAVHFETSLNSIVDGDLNTFASFAGATANSTYLQFDFNSEIELSSVSYQNSEAAKAYSDDHIYGGKYQYYDSTLQDYVDIPSSILGENKTVNTYNKQFLYLRDRGITTNSIRFMITDVAGWIIAGDFVFNEYDSRFSNPSITVQTENASGVHEGAIINMLDNDSSTYCWFDGRITSVTYDFGKSFLIHDVHFLTGNGVDGDKFNAFIEISTDNDTYVNLVENYTPVTEDTIVLESSVQARYVRLTKYYGAGWNSIKDFTVNNTDITFDAFGDNLVKPAGVSDNDEANVVDGDLDTTVWYDYKFSRGSYFLLDLKEQTSVDNVYFLQGGFTNDSYVHRVYGNYDQLMYGKLSYSKDGVNWTDTDADCTIFDLIYEFANTITARYFKVTFTGSEPAQYGIVIREFGVNFSSKLTPTIDWGTDDTPSYTGEAIRGLYRVPFNCGDSYVYKNLRTNQVTAVEPVNPGEYRVTISFSGNDIYNSISDASHDFHIMDTPEHFISDWEAMIEEEHFCDNSDALKDLLDRYDNDLSSSDKAIVDIAEYTGFESNTYTIADGVAYAREHFVNNNSNNNGIVLLGNVSSNNTMTIIIIASISLISLLAIGLYCFKKSKDNK